MTIDEIKQIVEFMQTRGVIKFKAGELEVEFGVVSTSPDDTAKILLGESPSERLSNLKSAVEAIKREAQEDELWSV